MPVIRLDIEIAAPPEVCFDLARNVDALAESGDGKWGLIAT